MLTVKKPNFKTKIQREYLVNDFINNKSNKVADNNKQGVINNILKINNKLQPSAVEKALKHDEIMRSINGYDNNISRN